MEAEKKTSPRGVDPDRPKGKTDPPWGTGGCPFIIFGDDCAAKYDLDKMKKFFDRFKKKKK